MRFRAVYPNATKFKYIVQTIVKLADLVPFTADEKGLRVVILSPDKTTMTILSLPAESFEEYEVAEGKVEFHLASDELNRVAKRGTRNDKVELVAEPERFKMVFVDQKSGVTRTFYLQYKEAVAEPVRELKLDLPVMVRMLASDFKEILRDAKLVGDELVFSVEDGKLVVKSESQQKEYTNIMREGSPLISLSYPEDQEVVARYGLDALQAVVKATSAAEAMTLEFGKDLPMKLTFELPMGGTLIYWVAPRTV